MKIYIGEFEGNHWAVESEREKPVVDYPATKEGCHCEECEWYFKELSEYEAYLASLPRILCSDSLVQGLKVGDVLPECREQKQHKLYNVWREADDDEYTFAPTNYRRIMLVPVEAKQTITMDRGADANKNAERKEFTKRFHEDRAKPQSQGEDELWETLLGYVKVNPTALGESKDLITYMRKNYTITRKQ